MAPVCSLLFFLYCFCREFCSALDTITKSQIIQDNQSIVSANGTFKLGLFSPPNSANRYVGIWYNKPVMNVVWVANRKNPVDSSGVLKIADNGHLQLLNGKNNIIWSTNVSNKSVMNTSAQLLDTGNLVLLQSNTSEALWQSFDHPSNAFIPGMNTTVPSTPNKNYMIFRSWKSPSDPSEGNFAIGIGTSGLPQIVTWDNKNVTHWRTGPWDGNNFIGLPNVDKTLNDGFVLDIESATVSMVFHPDNASLLFNYVVDSQGTIKELYWDVDKKNWKEGWLGPSIDCEVYATCGAYGTCDHVSLGCKCLQGFQPKNLEEWKRGNWSRGCVRRAKLECGTQGGDQDGFFRLQHMKVPDNMEKLPAFSQDICRSKCLNNCSCLAYTYHLNIGCMIWNKDLIDTQTFSEGDVDLFLRIASSELGGGKSHMKTVVITSMTIIGAVVAVILIYFLRSRLLRRGKQETEANRYRFEGDISQLHLQEPPLYTFDMLKVATNDFHGSNKLGEGGFGSVYKGVIENGNEIAVKRLSRSSGQGLEEFMNEVTVISKLQHRNLVRLLGCCVERDEKMLIYEYMPNGSLDALIFDPLHQRLPWEKRFNIIEGICRGLLYLHRDSRLRIIHRDLKPSNILLDGDLIPKISDFGMARIFGGNQDQANTRRVVGTYGYMSPEYALGNFSEKSDVYSFGVILLEIISGRKNNTFHRSEQSLTLTGHAWKLWNEGNIESFIDPTLSGPSFQRDIIRCIQIGLLCAQELPKDRPTISTVISMFDTDIKQLPQPKKPPFTEWEISSEDRSSTISTSINNLSITVIQGR